MKRKGASQTGLSTLACCFAALVFCNAGQAQWSAKKSPVTVADCIEMTELVAPNYNVGGTGPVRAAQFSPDAKRFVILVKSGNLETNANKYSLLLFNTASALHSPRPEILVSFSSTSNSPGIQETRWLNNRRISFLAENPGEVPQLYTIDCDTKRVTRITDQATGVLSYAIGPGEGSVFILAAQRVEPLLDEKTTREGFVVTHQNLYDLITRERAFHIDQFSQLFVQRRGARSALQIHVADKIASDSISLSPNGRYLLFKTYVDPVPEPWIDYRQDWVRFQAQAPSVQGAPPTIVRYQFLDVDTGQIHPLMDAPIHLGHSELAWSADSRSVVMSDLCLPLDGLSGAERSLRESSSFVAEIKIPSGEIVPITADPLKLVLWDAKTDEVVVDSKDIPSTGKGREGMIAFRRLGDHWQKVEAVPKSENAPLEIELEEDMNTPPRLFAKSLGTGQESLLFDLNPQFQKRDFATVKDITFEAIDGHRVRAGLYLPLGYVPGKKYPLVIQTHAWNADKFLIDGPWPSGFAAQPLAAHGMVVLQLEEDFSKIATRDEAPEEMAAYEGGIQYLDGLGMIDRNRVGIVGFSRTGLGVKYTLTHSRYRFAAATVADGSDGGYFSYLAFLTSIPVNIPDFEGVNGGAPFGEDLLHWLRNSPGFNLDKVTSPVREEAYEPLSLLVAWEWFAGLSRLRKPVELVYLPDASHVLIKPWERRVSQQGNVDWFCFWLKGEEDSDPAKKEQYERWRNLRGLRATAESALDRSSR